MPLQHQHHPVPPPDAQGGKVVGALVAGVLDVLEGEAPLFVVLVDVEHRQLVRIGPRNPVHDVEAEVERLRVREGDGRQPALRILFGVDELRGHQVGRFLPGRGRRGRDFLNRLRRFPGQHYRHEHAVLAVHRDHAVGQGGIVVDAVAFVQDFRVATDLHLHASLQHQVKFLARVGRQVDRLVLRLFGVFIAHPVGLGLLVPEFWRQVGNGDAFLPRGGFTLAPPGHRIGGQEGVVPFQQLRQFHVEGLRRLVDEGERQVRLPGFVQPVFLGRHLGFLRHVLRRPAENLPHLPQSGSDCAQLVQVCLGRHVRSPPSFSDQNKMTRLCFETGHADSRYHSNCVFPHPFRHCHALCIHAAVTGDAY